MLRNLSRSAARVLAGVAVVALWPLVARSQVPAQPAPVGSSVPESVDDKAPPIDPPRALAPLSVDYPPNATGEATVELTLTIDAEGSVRSATVTRGDEPFASVARERAAGWKFSPALREGKPIASVIRVEVRFTPPEPIPAEPDAPPTSPGEPPSSAPIRNLGPGKSARMAMGCESAC